MNVSFLQELLNSIAEQGRQLLGRRLLNVEDMPLDFFDRLAKRGRACWEPTPTLCGLSALR